jgi:hypothetical protein
VGTDCATRAAARLKEKKGRMKLRLEAFILHSTSSDWHTFTARFHEKHKYNVFHATILYVE